MTKIKNGKVTKDKKKLKSPPNKPLKLVNAFFKGNSTT